MKRYTYEELHKLGYQIQNGVISKASLCMKDYGCLTLNLAIEGDGWGVIYGGYCLGKGYLGADDKFFKGSEKGLEAIMRIMDTVGVEDIFDLEGKYVRIANKGWGDPVKIIGNIIDDKWFDYGSFFGEE